jgi:hypothetical protein
MHVRKIFRPLCRSALVLALAAIAVPTAQAGHAPAEVGLGTPAAADVDAATRHHHPEVAQTPTRIVAVASSDGFDWGDAGIGAGALFGAALLAAGSALLLKRDGNGEITLRSKLRSLSGSGTRRSAGSSPSA